MGAAAARDKFANARSTLAIHHRIEKRGARRPAVATGKQSALRMISRRRLWRTAIDMFEILLRGMRGRHGGRGTSRTGEDEAHLAFH